ncbi:hypothetical protein TRFO_09041 [Tritrichomonas foetus]|uniref:DUF3447 domain-containing protein n=1 Tax=Tritrichomonas foetus TaxID=1144522 RepID=A0A1J4JLN2_9EUKA|nr:hypothetical protein TRFO_09041 [Tritrichomonas foetus]|eukprot:OHS98180.1 hypothetical protein TRFO_09041 [Tritrichomonas foetus]
MMKLSPGKIHELETSINMLKEMQLIFESAMEIHSLNEITNNISLAELFNMFQNIDIKNNYPIYEAFLQILSHKFFINHVTKNVSLYYTILEELIIKHSLLKVFHYSTITAIFYPNPILLLHINTYSYQNCKEFILNEKQLKELKINVEEFENNTKIPNNEPYSNIGITQIIREDNLNAFIQYLSNENFDLNSQIVNPYLNHEITLLEYSMIYGSINIFKYLWLNKALCSQESLKYSIIGGNYDIIHILEDETKYLFEEECLRISIKYHQRAVTEYLLTTSRNNFSLSRKNKLLFYLDAFDFLELNNIMEEYLIDENMGMHEIVNEMIPLRISIVKTYLLFDFFLHSFDIDINYKELIHSIMNNNFKFYFTRNLLANLISHLFIMHVLNITLKFLIYYYRRVILILISGIVFLFLDHSTCLLINGIILCYMIHHFIMLV